MRFSNKGEPQQVSQQGRIMVKVLYTDDEADICELVQMALELDPEFEFAPASPARMHWQRLDAGNRMSSCWT